MSHNLDLIYALAGGLTAALLLGYIARKLRCSPLVGYLVAGMLVGSHTPGIQIDQDTVNQFAEIGVILLMFGVGLHFHLRDLIAVQRVALPGAIAQIAASTALGAAAAHAFGWGWEAGVVYGMSISVASTVVLTRVLSDHRELHTPGGHVAVGWLVVEDLFTILLMVFLPLLLEPGREARSAWSLAGSVGAMLAKLVLLLAVMLWAGRHLIPRLLTWVARTGTCDLFTLAVLVLAIGIAVISAEFFGASMVLGAFLSGMAVGQSDFSARAAADALPMRDAFAVLFFVSVGMMFDPVSLLNGWPLALVTLGIVMAGKPLAAFAVVRLLRKPLRLSLSVAAALAQIGEFSFILVAMGTRYGLLAPETHHAVIAASVVSIALNSLIYGRLPKICRLLCKRGFRETAPCDDAPEPADEEEDRQRVIIVGYGPSGQVISRILTDNHVEVVVIEMNIDTVRRLHRDGVRAVYGDAAQSEVLKAAGAEKAEGLIISTSGALARDVIDAARSLNSSLRILVHTVYLADARRMRRQLGTLVFSGEKEVALSMATHLLEQFGASEEQIEQERNRIHTELD